MTDLILLAAIFSVMASVVSLFAFPRQISQLAGFGVEIGSETVASPVFAATQEIALAPEFSFSGEAIAA